MENCNNIIENISFVLIDKRNGKEIEKIGPYNYDNKKCLWFAMFGYIMAAKKHRKNIKLLALKDGVYFDGIE